MIETLIFGFVLAASYIITGSAFGAVLPAALAAGGLALAAAVAALRKNGPLAKQLGVKAAVFLLVSGGVYGVNWLSSKKARSGAEQLAAVCETYKEKTGAYPGAFRDLVPGYIEDIPAARVTAMWAQYRLVGTKIMYVLEPGLLAAAYDLSEKKWGVVSFSEMFPKKTETAAK